MSKGAFLIARNNGHIDYVKQAVFLAKRIKKYLNIPVTVATDSVDYLKDSFDIQVFDQIISLDYTNESNLRYFFDGALTKKTASFKNNNRASVFFIVLVFFLLNYMVQSCQYYVFIFC